MCHNLLKMLICLCLLSHFELGAQEIWHESFGIPDKGIWGDDDGTTIHVDFDGVPWSLNYSDVLLTSPDAYAKTVKTSGGRFECRDINGELTWSSTVIDISEYKNITVQLVAKETGSGKNKANKYLKAFYRLDNEAERPFETNAENAGNWGENIVSQTGLNGQTLQIVVLMNNHYVSNKVILDEIGVTGEEKNPVIVEPGDVLINEVLFNPVENGGDFVEIYNYSDKQIPLNKLYIASRDKDAELTQIYSLASEKNTFEPESYLALTKDTNGVFPYFTIECPGCFLQMDKFPSFNNDEDYVVLLNNEKKIIDELHYTEDLHLPMFHDVEGISLERISFSASTNEAENWHSASTTSGYGTPGYLNSQSATKAEEKIAVSFEPEAFSPNDDGYNDTYCINFKLNKPGYLCNVWIYDAAGRLVTQLANNYALGTNDKIIWNGRHKNGTRMRIGVYVVLVEIFDLSGSVKHFKDGVVLTDILE